MRIDHVELFVPDREAAVSWYAEWLGFAAMREHAAWVATGPVMITNDGGFTKIALFTGEPQGDADVRGWRRLAFGLDADRFIAFVERYRESGQALNGPVDHHTAWSAYFSDPWGNLLEVTTYDYDAVRDALDSKK